MSRPPVAEDRLALTASGQVRFTLKTPYRDGTTHIVLEPLDFIARLAAQPQRLKKSRSPVGSPWSVATKSEMRPFLESSHLLSAPAIGICRG